MALVDYDDSCNESEEDESNINFNSSEENKPKGGSLHAQLATLPLPIKNNNKISEEMDEFLNRKTEPVEKPSKHVKIKIPDLPSFVDEDTGLATNIEKKMKSGLFAVLPPPKVVPLKNTCFLPNSLQKPIKDPAQKNEKGSIQQKQQNIKEITFEIPKSQALKRHILEDTDTDDEEGDLVPASPLIDDQTWGELFLKQKRIAVRRVKKPAVQSINQCVIDLAPNIEKPYMGLSNQAFKELLSKEKKTKEEINITEVAEDKIHPDREEWLKSLTDPNFEASPEIKTPVNRTSFVKNHITSLAERALANDKDLQMRWAESRHSRNQTRTKYGF